MMPKSDQRIVRELAQEHRKIVRQLTMNKTDQHKTCRRNFAIKYVPERVISRQTDSHRVRSPLKMHRLNQPKTVSCDQQSEYDSTPEEEDHQPGEDQEKESGVENYEMPVTPVNVLSKNNRLHSNELHIMLLYFIVFKQKAKNHQFDRHTFCFLPITGSFKFKNSCLYIAVQQPQRSLINSLPNHVIREI